MWTQTLPTQVAVSQGPALAVQLACTHVAPLWHPFCGSQRPPVPHTASDATYVQRPPVQLSVVQPTPSSHTMGAPAWQLPPPHVSPTVQAFPSSQLAAFASCAQPMPMRQASVVHGFASSQVIVPAPTHDVPSHTSPTVHGSPSSQLPMRAVWRQAEAAVSQKSVVQGAPSSQPLGTHDDPQHVSPAPQANVRTQRFPWHVAVWQPLETQVAAVHVSYWHPFVASQRPPVAAVQAPSSTACTQPVPSQLSTVQST